MNLSKPQQTLIATISSGGPQKEDIFHSELVDSWMTLGFTFKALGNRKLEHFPEIKFCRTIFASSTLSNNYAITFLWKVLDIQRAHSGLFRVLCLRRSWLLNNWKLCLTVNCYNWKLDNQKTRQPHLAEITNQSYSPNSVLVVQKLMKIRSKLQVLQEDTDYQKFWLLITDAASYCMLTGKQLKAIFRMMIYVTCVSHMVARDLVDKVTNAKTLVSKLTGLFLTIQLHATKNWRTSAKAKKFPFHFKLDGELGDHSSGVHLQ